MFRCLLKTEKKALETPAEKIFFSRFTLGATAQP